MGLAWWLGDDMTVKEKMSVVAWDIFESRIYGAPGETRHRVLWVDHYTKADGTDADDLAYLLNGAREPGGIDGGARTISIRALYAVDEEDGDA